MHKAMLRPAVILETIRIKYSKHMRRFPRHNLFVALLGIASFFALAILLTSSSSSSTVASIIVRPGKQHVIKKGESMVDFVNRSIDCFREKTKSYAPLELWRNLAAINVMCSVYNKLPLRGYGNSFFIHPRPGYPDASCLVVSLGIGDDIDAERALSNENAACDFVGADPRKKDALYRKIGKSHMLSIIGDSPDGEQRHRESVDDDFIERMKERREREREREDERERVEGGGGRRGHGEGEVERGEREGGEGEAEQRGGGGGAEGAGEGERKQQDPQGESDGVLPGGAAALPPQEVPGAAEGLPGPAAVLPGAPEGAAGAAPEPEAAPIDPAAPPPPAPADLAPVEAPQEDPAAPVARKKREARQRKRRRGTAYSEEQERGEDDEEESENTPAARARALPRSSRRMDFLTFVRKYTSHRYFIDLLIANIDGGEYDGLLTQLSKGVHLSKDHIRVCQVNIRMVAPTTDRMLKAFYAFFWRIMEVRSFVPLVVGVLPDKNGDGMQDAWRRRQTTRHNKPKTAETIYLINQGDDHCFEKYIGEL